MAFSDCTQKTNLGGVLNSGSSNQGSGGVPLLTPTPTPNPTVNPTATPTPSPTASTTPTPTPTATTSPSGNLTAPARLFLVNQDSSSSTLSWSTVSGSGTVSYKIYRSVDGGAFSLIGTSTTTSFTDSSAPNTAFATMDHQATIYAYAVSAVDKTGESATQTNMETYFYSNGTRNQGVNCPTDLSWGVTDNWSDTAGAPPMGGNDVMVQYTNQGGFQPSAGPNLSLCFNLEVGAFNYFTFQAKGIGTGTDFEVDTKTRVPFGDIFPYISLSVGHYPIQDIGSGWSSYKIPMKDLAFGKTTFQGYIGAPYGTVTGTSTPYATLTVTSTGTGVGLDGGTFLSGGSLSNAYISGPNGQGPYQNKQTYWISGGGINSGYTLGSSTAPTTFNADRTSLYKFSIKYVPTSQTHTIYLNNIGWTVK